MLDRVKLNAERRTAGQSIDRTSSQERTDSLPRPGTEHRPIAQTTTGPTTADTAHTTGVAARREQENSCFRVHTNRPSQGDPPRFGAGAAAP